MKINQKGFTAVEILIAIIVIALVGGAGWIVHIRQKSPEQTSTTKDTSRSTKTIQETTDPEVENETIELTTISNDKFTVGIPSEWNYRTCMDHDGVISLVTGGGGQTRCIWDDADWIDTDTAQTGKVAIGYGSNPYPRQDHSSGEPKDVYETDANTLDIDGLSKVLKYNYSAEDSSNKGQIFKVTEYVIDDKLTIFIFDGHSLESDYINEQSSEDIIKAIEENVLTSIKFL